MSLFNISPHFEAQKVASLPIPQPHFQSFMDSKPISKRFNCTKILKIEYFAQLGPLTSTWERTRVNSPAIEKAQSTSVVSTGSEQ